MAEKTKIVIWGSCVSRDIFNLVQDRYSILLNIQRNSLKCFSGDALELPEEVFHCAGSSWNAKMLQFNCWKMVPQSLREKRGDLLLIDLVDDRFRLVRIRYKGKEILLPYYQSVQKLLENWKDAAETEIIPLSQVTEAQCTLWVKNAAQMVREIYGEEQIIIHEFYLMHQYLDDELKICDYPGRAENERINAHLRMLYGMLEAQLPNARVIRMPAETMGEPHHIWGLASSHAQISYYQYALSCIDIICGADKFSTLEQRLAIASRENVLRKKVLQMLTAEDRTSK